MAGNYDYDLEASDIARKQRIADAMMSGALAPMGPTEMVSGHAIRKSPLEGIAKVLQVLASQKQQGDLKDEQKALSGRYASDLAEGMQQYDKTSRGYSSPLGEDLGGNVIAAQDVKADPRKAIFDAMASNHPVLRDFAMKQMAEQAKSAWTPEKLAHFANPADVVKNPNDPSTWTGKPNLTPVTPGSAILDTNSNKFVAPGGTQPTVETIGGDLYQRAPSGVKKLDNAPKVVVDMGGKASEKFATKLAEGRADTLVKSYEATKGLPQTLITLDEASKSLRDGIKSGIAGEVGLTLAKLGKALGFGDVSPEIANTEAFRSQMAQSTLEVLKTLRPASDSDVKYAEKAAGGSITLDDKTMMRLIDSSRAATASKLYNHNQLLEANKKASGAIPEDLDTYNIPFSVSGDNMEFRNGQFVTTTPAEATPKAGAAGAIRKFNPATGRIE